MFVKICGISNAVDATFAYDQGADALGFVMGGKVLPPEVEASAQHIRAVIKRFRQSVKTFLVTHLLDPEDILALSQYLGVSGIQISEPLDTPVLERLRRDFSGDIIKTVAVVGAKSYQELQRVEPYCDMLLLDSSVAGYIGGTGRVSDWAVCAGLRASTNRPVLLAGGLNPNNIQEAIRQIRPAGVDVSTGVSSFGSDYLRKDRKDPEKIQAFIQEAKEVN